VLRKSGRVVSMAAVNEIIKKDMVDPFDGTPLKDTDIIELQRGGTGYAGSGVTLEAKKYTAALNF
jgi:nitric oxide synthase-interacting protein